MPKQQYVEVRSGKSTGSTARIPVLEGRLLQEILAVEPSRDGELVYRPCCVEVESGQLIDRVYFAEAFSWHKHWGVWPLDDPGKSSFSIARVKRIFSSPSRFPALLANKLYRGGETSMGGTSFALILRDGRRIPVLTGNAVDFPEYPPEVKPSDIVDVIHGYNEISASRIGTANYYWCLYTTRS
jgi:hypothetical protein